MALSNGENGLTAADVAAVVGNGGNGWGFGNDGGGLFYLLILFLFAGGFNGGWGNGNNCYNDTMMPYLYNSSTQNEVARGFDQSGVMNSLSNLNAAISNGFANAEVSRCNQQTNVLQAMNNNQAGLVSAMNANQAGLLSTMNSNQNALIGQLYNNQMNLNTQLSNMTMAQQKCCCDNELATESLRYTIATENCADRTALNEATRDIIASQTSTTQAIMDKLCQLELDSVKQQNAQLLADNNTLRFVNSQTAQTAAIEASQAQQTAQVLGAINAQTMQLDPPIRPAYIVPNPNGCNCGNINYGCGSCG